MPIVTILEDSQGDASLGHQGDSSPSSPILDPFLRIGERSADTPAVSMAKKIFLIDVMCLTLAVVVVNVPLLRFSNGVGVGSFGLLQVLACIGSIVTLKKTGNLSPAANVFFMPSVLIMAIVQSVQGGFRTGASVIPLWLAMVAIRLHDLSAVSSLFYGCTITTLLALELTTDVKAIYVPSNVERSTEACTLLLLFAVNVIFRSLIEDKENAASAPINVRPQLTLQTLELLQTRAPEATTLDECIEILNGSRPDTAAVLVRLQGLRRQVVNPLTPGQKIPTQNSRTGLGSDILPAEDNVSEDTPTTPILTPGRGIEARYNSLKVLSKATNAVFMRIENRLTQERMVAINLIGPEARFAISRPPMNHPNIIQMVEGLSEGSDHIIIYADCDQNLRQIMNKRALKNQPLPEDKILVWGVQILSALHYLHNVLRVPIGPITDCITFVNGHNQVHIGDAAIARAWREKEGLDHILAPELIGGPKDVNPTPTPASDVWGFGLLLHTLAFLHPPFPDLSFAEASASIRAGEFVRIPEMYSGLLAASVASMLDPVPEKRPSISQLLSSPPWRTAAETLCGSSANKRLGPVIGYLNQFCR
jgi:hypothetical protein